MANDTKLVGTSSGFRVQGASVPSNGFRILGVAASNGASSAGLAGPRQERDSEADQASSRARASDAIGAQVARPEERPLGPVRPEPREATVIPLRAPRSVFEVERAVPSERRVDANERRAAERPSRVQRALAWIATAARALVDLGPRPSRND